MRNAAYSIIADINKGALISEIVLSANVTTNLSAN